MTMYRMFAFELPGGFMRIDDFTDDVTTLEEAKAFFEGYRKNHGVRAGVTFILTQEIDSFRVAVSKATGFADDVPF